MCVRLFVDMRDMTPLYVCDMTHSHVWQGCVWYMWHASFTRVTKLVRLCAMTHLFNSCDITHPYTLDDSHSCLTWLRAVCVTWLIYMRDMTRSFADTYTHIHIYVHSHIQTLILGDMCAHVHIYANTGGGHISRQQ